MLIKEVGKYRVELCGVDHAQYWPGRGLYGTDYDEVAVGIGMSAKAAFEDAMDDLSQIGWIVDRIDGSEAEDQKDVVANKFWLSIDLSERAADGGLQLDAEAALLKPGIEVPEIDVTDDGQFLTAKGSHYSALSFVESFLTGDQPAVRTLSADRRRALESRASAIDDASEFFYYVAIYVRAKEQVA